ncbi:biosynthetic-type acetolactate synthase large subunit [bacterium]|nr:biosynthetic-type acetolactate synthase large subunit [bacterium]
MATPAKELHQKIHTATPLKGAQILEEALWREGVRVMFGYPGGASMEIHQALTRADRIRVVLPRHEQGGGFAAQGYARTTGKVGVVLATSGPGATNLATPIADAKLDSIPIVAITGQVPTPVIGRDAFQETDVVGLTRTVTKHNYMVTDVNDIARIVKEAFHIAATGRPGPVLIDIPKNIQQALTVPNFDQPMDLPGYKPTKTPSPAQVRAAAQAIMESERPVLYIGGGCIHSEATEVLIKLAEKCDIPVVSTVMGLGGFPARHPLFFDMLGMHGSVYANWAVSQADLLIAAGVRFDDRVTGKVSEFAKHGRIIHIDVDASEINKNKPVQIPIVADAKLTLEAILSLVKPAKHREWAARIEEEKKKFPYRYDRKDTGILPQYVLEELNKLVEGKDTIITMGVGQHQMWAAQWLKMHKPRTFLSSSGLGSMGFGYPAALGAKLAFPDHEVVDIDGDGSFIMNIQELATAYTEKIAAKALILNNRHLGMVVQWEDRFYEAKRAQTFIGDPTNPDVDYPDFVGIAKACNLPGRHVTKKSDVKPALEEMLAAKTAYVLDVSVKYSEHVLPMIPAGKTFADTIYE